MSGLTTTATGDGHWRLVARVLAERLQGREPPGDLRAALLCGGGLRWEDAVAQASDGLVLPAFAAALRDFDLLAPLEPELAAFLAVILAANVERNTGLRHELTTVVDALNRVAIEPVLLKGAIRLVDRLYPDPGWRMMRDLDLLVPEPKLDAAVEALREVGYAPCQPPPPDRRRAPRHHHYPGLVRPGCVGMVEIHTELFSSARRRRLLSGAEVLREARRVTLDGVRAGVPSVEHQMTHLIGHCQISNRYVLGGEAQLRDLLEAAAVQVWSPEPLDWQRVRARFVANGHRGSLRSFLLCAEDAGFGPTVAATELHPRSRLWRRRRTSPEAARIAPIGLRTALWSAFLGELVREPEMRKKLLRWSADAIFQRRRRGRANLGRCDPAEVTSDRRAPGQNPR